MCGKGELEDCYHNLQVMSSCSDQLCSVPIPWLVMIAEKGSASRFDVDKAKH